MHPRESKLYYVHIKQTSIDVVQPPAPKRQRKIRKLAETTASEQSAIEEQPQEEVEANSEEITISSAAIRKRRR
jgi:hypothetical protein